MSERVSEFEILVVGGGPAGLASACVAAESGARVCLVDETPWLGGQIWRGQQTAQSNSQARRWLERFRRSGAELAWGTRVTAVLGPETLLATDDTGAREFRWHRLILATGARELFLPFPGWTLPGVIGPGGLQGLVKNGWPIRAQKVVVAGSGPLLLAVADGLKAHGAEVVSINEQAPWQRVRQFGFRLVSFPDKLGQGLLLRSRLWGVPYRCGTWPVQVDGDTRVRRVALTDGRQRWTEECDLLACGFGLVPNLELPIALGCALEQGFVLVNDLQTTSVPGVFCAGEANGIGGADCALLEGQIAGYTATNQLERAKALAPQRRKWDRFRSLLASAFELRTELKVLAEDETLVCRCEDVNYGRLRQFSNWREAKLQTRCGMGSCQGRVCGAAAKVVLGWEMESVRPPLFPTRVEQLVS